MAMAKLALRCLPGIDRPAIAGLLPAKRDCTLMLDLGANIVCDPGNLVQFAVLGTVYARAVRGIENPAVGLLNVGSEAMKGPDGVRDAAAILSDISIPGRFIGFVEGYDITNNSVDVIVTDGFTGNVSLKVAEGVGRLARHYMKEAFSSSLMARIGGLFALGAISRLRRSMDPRFYNGGMFLGLNGICVKSHGSMDAYGFSRAILKAERLVSQGYNEKVAAEMARIMRDPVLAGRITGRAAAVQTPEVVTAEA